MLYDDFIVVKSRSKIFEILLLLLEEEMHTRSYQMPVMKNEIITRILLCLWCLWWVWFAVWWRGRESGDGPGVGSRGSDRWLMAVRARERHARRPPRARRLSVWCQKRCHLSARLGVYLRAWAVCRPPPLVFPPIPPTSDQHLSFTLRFTPLYQIIISYSNYPPPSPIASASPAPTLHAASPPPSNKSNTNHECLHEVHICATSLVISAFARLFTERQL